MCQTVLVPLDGSILAEQALPLALHIAERAGATLRLVRAHVLYLFKNHASAWAPCVDQRYEAQWKSEEQGYLDGVAKRLAERSSTPVTTVLAQGEPADGVLNEAQLRHADLIVMAAVGRGRWSRFLCGSVADEIVRRAAVPVILVPARDTATVRLEERTPRHMLIPLDGSELAEDLLPALEIGRHLDARYTLLRVLGRALLDGSGSVNGLGKPDAEFGQGQAMKYLAHV